MPWTAMWSQDAEGETLARVLGNLFCLGALATLCWVALPEPGHPQRIFVACLAGVALALGCAMVSGSLDRLALPRFEAIVALATLMISLVVYLAGSPTNSFGFGYLFATPVAFWFFPHGRALGQVALIALSYGAVVLIGHDAHPQTTSGLGHYLGHVLLLIAMVVAVGEVVRILGRTVRERDARFQAMVHNSPIGIVRTSTDGQILEVNPAFSAIVGREPAELIGQTGAGLVPPEAASEHLEAQRARARVEDQILQTARRFVRADGTTGTATVAATIVRSAGADPEVWYQVVDITERVRTEDQLLTFSRLIDQTDILVALTDLDGQIRYLNRAGRQMLAVEEDGAPEESAALIGIGAIPGGMSELLRRGHWQGEVRIRPGNRGPERDIDLRALVVRDEAQRPVAVGVIERDISESKRAAAELRASEARLQAILANAPAEITIWDAEGRLTLANDQAQRRFHTSASELIGRSYEQIFSAERARQARSLHAMAERDPRVRLVERRRDGSTESMLVASFALPESGGSRSVGHISVNVTERERMRAELDRANEARRDLLARLVAAQEDERRRLAAGLHDDAIQVMTGVAIRLGLLADELGDRRERERVEGLEALVGESIRGLRRMLFELRPRS